MTDKAEEETIRFEDEEYSPSNQTVWVFGYNGQEQLNFHGEHPQDGSRSVDSAVLASLAKRARYISLACSFTLVLFEDGSMQVFGKNPYIEAKVSCSGRIAQVSAGRNHAIALEEGGRLYSFGYNPFGQCGTPNGPLLRELQLIEFPGIETIVQCSAGDAFSLALSSEGRVFSFGKNDLGQLGSNIEGIASEPTLVEFPADVKITKIACGMGHSLAIDDKGELHSWGWNGYGQLGMGDTENRRLPHKVGELKKKVKSIACGGWHSACLTEDGEAYTWGWGEFGQLGHGDGSANSFPASVTSLKDSKTKLKSIAAGSRHTLFGSVNGQVWACGLASFGRTGGSKKGEEHHMTPVLVEAPGDQEVWRVFSGNSSWGSVCVGARRKQKPQQ
eukprot:TRINITY_DN3692_c0_g1_i1.p1 TRINITY_DN3692_c0_g1~~TRINITY_DN3692_c0_g1_i1.p1  ORF type:complete len:435 (+),score=125.33 TRINITY_DN3692_c0_g1_i1:143-1306(+)